MQLSVLSRWHLLAGTTALCSRSRRRLKSSRTLFPSRTVTAAPVAARWCRLWSWRLWAECGAAQRTVWSCSVCEQMLAATPSITLPKCMTVVSDNPVSILDSTPRAQNTFSRREPVTSLGVEAHCSPQAWCSYHLYETTDMLMLNLLSFRGRLGLWGLKLSIFCLFINTVFLFYSWLVCDHPPSESPRVKWTLCTWEEKKKKGVRWRSGLVSGGVNSLQEETTARFDTI